MTAPDFKAAAAFRMPFGKFQGMNLDKIAETDEGLRYLDWVIGQSWLGTQCKVLIGAYLADPTIAKEVERLARRG